MKKVTLYALSTCPWCRKTKKLLADHKIPFDCVDYDLTDKKGQERVNEDMKKRGGGTAFPFIIIDEVSIEGYNPEKIKQCLGITG